MGHLGKVAVFDCPPGGAFLQEKGVRMNFFFRTCHRTCHSIFIEGSHKLFIYDLTISSGVGSTANSTNKSASPLKITSKHFC